MSLSGYRLPVSNDALLDECDVTFFTASGPGGQHRNRSRTAVRLRHRPSGIVVIGKRERSQKQNVEDALVRLRDRVASRLHEPAPRRRTRPTKGSKERRVGEKKRRGDVKRMRGKVDRDG